MVAYISFSKDHILLTITRMNAWIGGIKKRQRDISSEIINVDPDRFWLTVASVCYDNLTPPLSRSRR